MNNQLTVLIPTSPIPSHPSTAILDQTISAVRNYTDAEILILLDGVHPSLIKRKQDYEEYKRNVHRNVNEGKYGLVQCLTFDEHTHQSEMTRFALNMVKTPLVFFVEHDTYPGGDIPFQQICDLVQSSKEINYVRFNIFEQIPSEHDYLMLGANDYDGIPLTRTIQFSARPHIAKSEWYREILLKYFKQGERMMVEDRLHSVVQTSYKNENGDIFGLAIYTPPGSQLRSFHSDARGDDEKIIYG